MKRDVIGLLILAGVSVALGLGLNRLRAKPLPMVYQTPAERLETSVADQAAATGKSSHAPPLSGGRENAEPIREISVNELKRLIGKREALILDARPLLFYEDGHIPSALNLSRQDFERDFRRLSPTLKNAKGKTWVIYCEDAGCEDSTIVAQALVRLGFGPARVFKGGWTAWEAAGGEVEQSGR